MKERIQSEESGSTPEQYKSNIDVITISGHPGTGKTVVAEKLAKRYGMDFIKIGEKFRDKIRQLQGDEVVDYVVRDEALDLNIDQEQAQLIRNANKLPRKVLLEGRLANIIATEELFNADLENRSRPNVFRILFTGDPRERARRVNKRFPHLSIEEIETKTRNREKGDLSTWRKFHPIIPRDKDIYDPDLKDRNGNHPFADLVIDTTKPTADEVAEMIHATFLQNNIIEKIEPDKKEYDPTTDSLTSQHAVEILTTSFVHAQNFSTLQSLFFDYIRMIRPEWNVSGVMLNDIYNEAVRMQKAHAREEGTVTPPHPDKKDQNTPGYDMELRAKILEFQTRLNAENSPRSDIIESITLGILGIDGLYLVDRYGKKVGRKDVPEIDRYLSYLCHYGMNHYTTGNDEFDQMYSDIYSYVMGGGLHNLNRETDAMLACIIKIYNNEHWAGKKNPTFITPE